MQNLRRGINRILIFLLATQALVAGETEYLASVDGVYSVGSKYLPDSVTAAYPTEPIAFHFTDYGGRFFRTFGDWGYGISLHLYSAFNGRSPLNTNSSIVSELIARKTAETGGSYTLGTGNYRVGLGWVPLQVRLRKSWLAELLFAEIATGPAYGFGALEYTLTLNSVTPANETRYHKYSEWGWLTSAMVGIDVHLHTGLSLQIFTEGAWLYAKIRNPNLIAQDNISGAQFFLRPGLAFALRF